MITIYKSKKDIPQEMDYIELNDVFFNQNTPEKFDDRASGIVEKIDDARLLGRYKIQSKFGREILDVDRLSTGCKTVLNVMYFPDKVFCIKGCGENALKILYGLKQGAVYSDYAAIPFEMNEVTVWAKGEERIIDDYEALKEWWKDEE